jgi:periplasmic divalent cation tolerance protein
VRFHLYCTSIISWNLKCVDAPQTAKHCRISAKVFRKEALNVKLRVKGLQNVYVIVIVTTASKQEAESIAQRLLRERLIACANIIGPVSSFFNWSGKMEKAEEYLILMKSREDLFEKLAENVTPLHSYEVPELLVLPIVDGSKAYLNWLGGCLVGSKKS